MRGNSKSHLTGGIDLELPAGLDIPRRILMTADTIGGVWTYAMELACALGSHGVQAGIATMGAPLKSYQRCEAAKLENVTLFESEYDLEWMDDPWDDVDAAGEWLLKIAAQFKPQLVHLNGYAHAALPWNIPVLVVAHSCVLSWWESVHGERAPEHYQEYRERVSAGLESAGLVIAPTAAMLDFTTKLYDLRTPSHVIPNSRNSSLFRPGNKQPEILSSGRLWDHAKNIELIYAVAPYVNWKTFVAGDAVQLNNSLEATRSVHQLGRLSSSDLAARLSSVSIYAAPACYEPFGLGILEAALSGCALVLGDIPSLRETWSGAALFIPPFDKAAWCGALNMLAADHELRNQLSRRAMERGREFTPELMAQRYMGAYANLMSGRMDFSNN